MTLRHLLSWKPLFFDALLPTLRRLGPVGCDAALTVLGRTLAAWPPRARHLARRLEHARFDLGAHWNPRDVRTALAANHLRFVARDYTLAGLSDAEALDRFDLRGVEHLDATLDQGRGVILLGCHLGGYLAAMHWMQRRGVPLRLMVQRPRHVSAELGRLFDRTEGPHPQSGFFLRRGMPAADRALRLIRARSALLDGLAVYINGDVAWPSSCARPGRLLGRRRTFLSAWADLAVLTGAPVVPVFCTHQPAGRFALSFDPPWTLTSGSEAAAVARYLERLEAEIVAHPADAVAHLLWPSFNTPEEPDPGARANVLATSPLPSRSLTVG
ncbi:hypothetical protein BH23PLA1_BH23PLA1_16870 [soil metagenome]